MEETTTLRAGGRGFVASPDGRSLAVVDGPKVCITSFDGGSKRCAGETLPADISSIRWSPDSKRVVFTETYVDIGQNRAAFVVEAASGKLVTLTDDNPSGVDAPESDVVVDLFPSFTPDGVTVVFWRFDLSAETATVMTVPATGGTPSGLATEVSIPGRAVAGRVTVLEQSILFSRKNSSDADRADIGIYRANRDGSALERIAGPTATQGVPEVRSVSAPLNTAIVVDRDQLDGVSSFVEPFSTLDLATGTLTGLTATTGVALGATFSPDGRQVLLVVGGASGPGASADGLSLAVRDGIGGPDVRLADVDGFVALRDAGGHSTQWLQGDRVLIANTFHTALSYQLA